MRHDLVHRLENVRQARGIQNADDRQLARRVAHLTVGRPGAAAASPGDHRQDRISRNAGAIEPVGDAAHQRRFDVDLHPLLRMHLHDYLPVSQMAAAT